MKPQELVKNIFDVGIIDWNMHDFHGFSTPRGVTYNSYLIMDEKVCLVDGVKAMYAEEQLANIKKVVDPAKIDAIIINHVEPDHSGSMPALAKACPNATFYISMQGKNESIEHYGDIFKFQVVKAGDTVKLGQRSLTFVPIPMLHWPDSMVTYCPEEQILFSSDSFGQHFCSSKRFDDEVDINVMLYEAQRYFANILFPYAKLIGPALKTVKSLPIKMLATCHGCIWRSHIQDILAKYTEWGQGKQDDKIVVVYDSMWGGTTAMARAIVKGISATGTDVKLYRYTSEMKAVIIGEILTAKAVLIGSPTQNYGMMPTIGAFMTYLKGLKPVGKKAAAFGTYGWCGGAQKDIEEFITKAGMELVPGYNCKWRPSPKEIEAAEQFGFDFATKLK